MEGSHGFIPHSKLSDVEGQQIGTYVLILYDVVLKHICCTIKDHGISKGFRVGAHHEVKVPHIVCLRRAAI